MLSTTPLKVESLDHQLSELRDLHSTASALLTKEKDATASLKAALSSKEEALSSLHMTSAGNEKAALDKVRI